MDILQRCDRRNSEFVYATMKSGDKTIRTLDVLSLMAQQSIVGLIVIPSGGSKIDPHTPVFDHDGILWFTNEETNYMGRLDPKTGKMSLTKLPTPHPDYPSSAHKKIGGSFEPPLRNEPISN
jgi:hypothetical protein